MINVEALSQEDFGRQRRPHILVGVTSAQTCLVLPGRIKVFREAGFRVSVLSAPGELLEVTARSGDASWYAIPMERGISLLADLASLVRIWRLLRDIKPDIVEFSTPKAGLLGTVAALLCRIPVRIYLLRGLRLETAHGIRRQILLVAERIAAYSAQLVICNSRSLRQRALDFHIAPARKLVVLGEGSSNGVDVERFSPGPSSIRGALGISADALVVGFAGRLTVDKGLPELIRAFDAIRQRQPDSYLLLVGWFDASVDALDGGMRAQIEGHPRILCTGLVADTAAYYRAMDVLVLPSWREGFPNVILEAAATGIPVVATGCTGSRDAVIAGVTGLLVPPGDCAALSEAVLSLREDAARRERMAKAARRWVMENFDSRQVLGIAVAFYKGLLDGASRSRMEADETPAEAATELPVLP